MLHGMQDIYGANYHADAMAGLKEAQNMKAFLSRKLPKEAAPAGGRGLSRSRTFHQPYSTPVCLCRRAGASFGLQFEKFYKKILISQACRSRMVASQRRSA
ncbi:MAG: hypothetical protein IJK77_07895 [Lachnospiraceae bacterium]|nr:hypothetical protein [Lachnospiraceae bacterium]